MKMQFVTLYQCIQCPLRTVGEKLVLNKWIKKNYSISSAGPPWVPHGTRWSHLQQKRAPRRHPPAILVSRFGRCHQCHNGQRPGSWPLWTWLPRIADGMEFIPLNVNMFVGWHKVALETLAKLGRQLARVVGRDESETVGHLRRRMSVILIRDNMQMLLRQAPDIPPSQITGDF